MANQKKRGTRQPHHIAGATASELAQAIATGQHSSTAVTEALLERIAEHNPALNCVVSPELSAQNARKTAAERDAESQRGQSRGPLHGVPVLLKDSWATRGLRTTNGFPGTADYVPDFDATVVARLRAAGAVILGKTNLSQLAMDVQSDNPVCGRSNNPYDLTRTPGGSSGGAAAAVAAGLAPADIGSDIGGSIRLPAHYCGVLGFKPTENAVSLFGHLPGLPEPEYTALRHLASAGPIARSFADLRLLFDIVRGPDPRDPKITPVRARTSLSGHKLRVAVLQPDRNLQLEAEYAQCYAKFLERLGTPRQTSAGGPQIELVDFQQALAEVAPPGALRSFQRFDLHACIRLWGRMVNAGMAPVTPRMQRWLTELFTGATPAARRRRPPGAEQIFPLSFAGWMRALTERDAWIALLEAGFAGGFDVLIAPVSGTAAFAHRAPDRQMGAVNLYTERTGESEYYRTHTGYTAPFNVCGNPTVSAPIGRTAAGLPLGVQMIGPRWGDLELLDHAEAIHTRVGEPVSLAPGY